MRNLCSFVYFLSVFYLAASQSELLSFPEPIYSKSDDINILNSINFQDIVGGKYYDQVVQFYDSDNTKSRRFAPIYKNLATNLIPWQRIVQFGVIDCSDDENSKMCNTFKVRSYPTLRILPPFFCLNSTDTGDILKPSSHLKLDIMDHLIDEFPQKFEMHSYSEFPIDPNYYYAFEILIFEFENSTLGSELILDLHQYNNTRVQRVDPSCKLAEKIGVKNFPAIVAYSQDDEFLEPEIIAEKVHKPKILEMIKDYFYEDRQDPDDLVIYTDLEKGIHTALTVEIVQEKEINGEKLQALFTFLDALKKFFPCRANLKNFLDDLYNQLKKSRRWNGDAVGILVKNLTKTHYPIYESDPDTTDYVNCKGSDPVFRGHPCTLWSLFHTLTGHAAGVQNPTNKEGPLVLQAMYGYIKFFFKRRLCARRFVAMAARNRLFDVKTNDEALLWLWWSHNEVNKRLHGEDSEDPDRLKIQFPSEDYCPLCRQDPSMIGRVLHLPGEQPCFMCRPDSTVDPSTSDDVWLYLAVKDYLKRRYGVGRIQ